MDQETIKKYFESELGEQCNSLFSTPDDRVFIRYGEAFDHCTENNLNEKEIKEWFEEWSGTDITAKVREVVAFIEEKADQRGWEHAEIYAEEKYGSMLTHTALDHLRDINPKPTPEQCFNALDGAINELLADHPEFEEEHSTGWDMIQILNLIKLDFAKKIKNIENIQDTDINDLPF